MKEDTLLGPVLPSDAVLRQLVQQPLQLLAFLQGQLGFCLAEPARLLLLQLLLPHHLHFALDGVHRPLIQAVNRDILILKQRSEILGLSFFLPFLLVSIEEVVDVSRTHRFELFFLIMADLFGGLVKQSFKHDFVMFDAGSSEIKNFNDLLL